MAAELIGPCRCPLCSGKARLTLSRNKLPVLTCNGCQIQLFARSDRSDQLCRSLLKAEPAPAAPPPPPPETPAEKAARDNATGAAVMKAANRENASMQAAQLVQPDIAQAAAAAQAQGFGLLKGWFQQPSAA